METNQIIELWKRLEIDRVEFEFSCGGDSMNDTTIAIYDKNENIVNSDDIEKYIDREVYNRVEFYVNSDGHYQGESGCVTITLDDEGDDLDYAKSSESEWTEQHRSTVKVELTDEMVVLVKGKVQNINGSYDEVVINYNGDCILSDKEEELVGELEELIQEELSRYEPEQYEGELGEWYSFTTNVEGRQIKIEGNELSVQIDNEITVYRED